MIIRTLKYILFLSEMIVTTLAFFLSCGAAFPVFLLPTSSFLLILSVFHKQHITGFFFCPKSRLTVLSSSY